VRPVDPRLLRHARAARAHLVVAVVLGLVATALIPAQAGPGKSTVVAVLLRFPTRSAAR
jgi:hypothetical protein